MFSNSTTANSGIDISFIGRNYLLVVKKDNCATIVARKIMRSSKQLTISSPRANSNTLSGPIESKYSAKEVTLATNEQSGYFLDYHQSKYWIVLSGIAVVEMAKKSHLLGQQQSLFIPAMQEHTIKNIGQDELVLVEFRTQHPLTGDENIEFIAGPNMTHLAV